MDELSKSIPGAEGAIDAEQSTNKRSGNEFCLNCGTKLLDTFCQHCGQKDIPRRQTLGELWVNFISSFWSYEGKFFTTTRYLITKPGFLAVEYNEGRRESFYHPARMYAFISFVFFLIFFSVTSGEESGIVKIKGDDNGSTTEIPDSVKLEKLDSILSRSIPYNEDTTYTKVGTKAWVDSVKKASKRKDKRKNKFNFGGENDFTTVESYDSVQSAKPLSERDGWFKRRMILRTIELNKKYSGDVDSFGKEFGNVFMDNFSKVLFFLLPVCALIFKLLYIRRDYYFSEHLVFSIYYYNFGYLAGSLQLLLGQISWLGSFPSFIGWWIFLYLLFAMKRMYQQSWRKTILKFIIFISLFFFATMIGVAVAAVVVLMVL